MEKEILCGPGEHAARGKSSRLHREEAWRLAALQTESLFRVASRFRLDPNDADDFVQECTVHLCEKLTARGLEIRDVSGWAFRVAVNYCKAWINRSRSDPASVSINRALNVPDGAATPDMLCEQQALRNALRHSAGRLSATEAVAIRNRFNVDLRIDWNETASIGALRAALERAIRKLAKSPELRAWAEDIVQAGAGRFQVDAGTVDAARPLLALGFEGESIRRLWIGLSAISIDKVLASVLAAGGWRQLNQLARRYPEAPILIRYDAATSRSEFAGNVRRLCDHGLPSRIVTCGEPMAESRDQREAAPPSALTLRAQADFELDNIAQLVLRASDAATLTKVADAAHASLRRSGSVLFDAVMRESLRHRRVSRLADAIECSVRVLGRKCQRRGLPTPKELLRMGTIFHVFRLARWTDQALGGVALALGLPDGSALNRLVRSQFQVTPSRLFELGGADYAADALTSAFSASSYRRTSARLRSHRRAGRQSPSRNVRNFRRTRLSATAGESDPPGTRRRSHGRRLPRS